MIARKIWTRTTLAACSVFALFFTQKLEAGQVPILVEWSGRIPVETKRKAPRTQCIDNANDWDKLITNWGLGVPLPRVNFQRCLVLVAVNDDENHLSIDAGTRWGDLRLGMHSTEMGAPGTHCTYVIALIPRKGVKTFNGKAVKPYKAPTEEEMSESTGISISADGTETIIRVPQPASDQGTDVSSGKGFAHTKGFDPGDAPSGEHMEKPVAANDRIHQIIEERDSMRKESK